MFFFSFCNLIKKASLQKKIVFSYICKYGHGVRVTEFFFPVGLSCLQECMISRMQFGHIFYFLRKVKLNLFRLNLCTMVDRQLGNLCLTK